MATTGAIETIVLGGENRWSPVCVSFIAGFLSASVAFYVVGKVYDHGGGSKNDEAEDDDDDDDDCSTSRRTTLLRWMSTMSIHDLQKSMDELKSHIGELPTSFRATTKTTRSRWPWDRSRSSSPSEQHRSHHHSTTTTTADNKSAFCIGSIFGLDVGGTLAKLVYFEQKAENVDSEFHPLRERFYRNSGNAQSALLRRASVDDHQLFMQPLAAVQLGERSASLAGLVDTPSSAFSRRFPSPHTDNGDSHLLLNGHGLRRESSTNVLAKGSMDDEMVPQTIFGKMKSKSSEDGGDIRRCRSMLDLSKDRTEALDRFYTFAESLDSYREGIKDHNLKFYSRQLGGEFHFIRFETRRMQNAMDLIRANNLHLNIREMGATGGGAHKFAAQWKEELQIEMQKQDELDSLVAGMQFVLATVVGECYTFRLREDTSSPDGSRSPSVGSYQSPKAREESASNLGIPINDEDLSDLDEDDSGHSKDEEEEFGGGDLWWWSRKVQRDAISESSTYPYLLVTIGTGVSILRVDGPRKHTRVSGSTIGGGTYWGLIRLLTDNENFEEVIKLAERGDPSKVDMMVGDIYGKNSDALEKVGLSANLVASSFGKLVAKEDPAAGLKEEDLARALLLMITINIGQVAYLNAQLHHTTRIYFVGNFLRQNKISQKRLSFAIDYWSKGQMEALFLEHEGYFGALGAFLLSQGIQNSAPDRSLKPQESMPRVTPFSSSSMRSSTSRMEGFHKRSDTAF